MCLPLSAKHPHVSYMFGHQIIVNTKADYIQTLLNVFLPTDVEIVELCRSYPQYYFDDFYMFQHLGIFQFEGFALVGVLKSSDCPLWHFAWCLNDNFLNYIEQ